MIKGRHLHLTFCVYLNDIFTYSKRYWSQVIHKSSVSSFTICRDQLPFSNFLFTRNIVTPQDFQATGSGLSTPHFPFIQEGIH